VRKGSVVEDQLGVGVSLFLLNCWIAGCQVLLSMRLSSRLKLLGWRLSSIASLRSLSIYPDLLARIFVS
jgi:hypothetical protein